MIIHQTLYNLFPFSSFNASSIAPFTPAEFIQRVLVPEAAVGLIMQDLHLDKDDAIVTLRESSQYGVAMFPDTGTGKGAAFGADDDDEGVADRIVMERAKARRLEIEKEEKIEEQMLKEEQAKRRSRAQTERKERALQRADQLKKSKGSAGYTSCEVSEASESESRCGQLKKTQKVGSRKATDSETDNMSVDSSTSRRSTRSRTGARIVHRTASSKSVFSDMQISDDSAVEIVVGDQQLQVRRSSRRVASSAVARPNDVGQLSDSSSSKTRTRRLKSPRGDDFDTDLHIGDTPLKPVREVDEESTPRPHWSKTPTVIRPHPTLGLPGATASKRIRSRSVLRCFPRLLPFYSCSCNLYLLLSAVPRRTCGVRTSLAAIPRLRIRMRARRWASGPGTLIIGCSVNHHRPRYPRNIVLPLTVYVPCRHYY